MKIKGRKSFFHVPDISSVSILGHIHIFAFFCVFCDDVLLHKFA